jgi:ABC-type multidrug transport system fused ATPase/permease subunit
MVLVSFLQNLLWAMGAVHAGGVISLKALQGALHTTISFFDTTPVGRIINRFSSDVDTIERDMAWAFKDMVYLGLYTLSIMLTTIIVVPFMLLIMPLIIWAYIELQKSYRASSREAKRLTSICRSPRFALFKESLEGLITLRAYHKLDYARERFVWALTQYQQVFHGMILVNRWFSSRVPLLSSLVVLGTGVGVLLLARWQKVSVGAAGLALIYARAFSGAMNEAVRAFSEAEARLTSVERLDHYSMLPAEEQQEEMGYRDWAVERGQIEFERVSMRYAPHLPLALNQVSFELPAGASVGIFGTTGSGKSTLFQVLFRFFALEEGRILIDGMDIRKIPLRGLRSQIAIIPQDPTLFMGTLRDNLDRFHQYEDAELWQVLERVHLAAYIKSLPLALMTPVSECGRNFSQGQRQLLCFARALLVKARIIALDEATASVDAVTSRNIQTILQREGQGKTILIIAHRLETLADCDVLIQMDKARVILHENRPGVPVEAMGLRSLEQGGIKVARQPALQESRS